MLRVRCTLMFDVKQLSFATVGLKDMEHHCWAQERSPQTAHRIYLNVLHTTGGMARTTCEGHEGLGCPCSVEGVLYGSPLPARYDAFVTEGHERSQMRKISSLCLQAGCGERGGQRRGGHSRLNDPVNASYVEPPH